MNASVVLTAARRILAASPWGFLTTTDEPVRTRVVQHLDVTDAAWIDDLAPFFPDGPTGDGFVLVRVVAHRVEV